MSSLDASYTGSLDKGKPIPICLSGNAAVVGNTTRYIPIYGFGGSSASEAPSKQRFGKCILKNLRVTVSQAPGVGQTYVITLRRNAGSETMTVTFSGGAQVTASDTTHRISIADGDLLDWMLVGSAGAATPTNLYLTVDMVN